VGPAHQRRDGRHPRRRLGRADGGTIQGFAAGRQPQPSRTVFSPGTVKSDSILTRLSVGEEVIQQPYAGQSPAILKSINAGRGPMAGTAGSKRLSIDGPVAITGRLVVDDNGNGELVDAFHRPRHAPHLQLSPRRLLAGRLGGAW
jgi:hypothetical protein